MKSSCISLIHRSSSGQPFLINLIDSPGHVDFSGEVSAAVRLCDGCLILVDVVEGVCPQTISALRQAWIEHLKPVLVMNKIDRLIVEQQVSPLDAYIRLQQLIEQLNVIVGELFTTDIFQEYSDREEQESAPRRQHKTSESRPDSYTFDWSNPLDEEDDSDLYFNPAAGNVIFASAVDCWAFSASSFAKILAQKLGISESALKNTLWGDFYIDNKKKKIFRGAQSLAKKPLFVQLVLENLWNAYDVIAIRKDPDKISKIVQSLGLQIPTRDLTHSDPRIQLKAILGQWLPLSQVVLESVVQQVPSPLSLEDVRIENFMCSKVRKFDHLPSETKALKQAFADCNSSRSAPRIVFISKMFSVNRKCLPEHKPRLLTPREIEERRAAYKLEQKERQLNSESVQSQTASIVTQPKDDTLAFAVADEIIIAFARIFSGSIRSGDELFVLGPKHDPSHAPLEVDPTKTLKDLESDQHVTRVTLKRIFVLMGRDLEEVDEAFAGNVIGLSDLENHVLKSATLSDSLYCPPFVDLHAVTQPPILTVAVEPRNPTQMPTLVQGLKFLNQSDPNVIVKLQETGEHVIITPGEVHLQKCIEDLEKSFAKIELNVSAPIVPFRETIIRPPTTDMVNETISNQLKSTIPSDVVEICTPNKKFRVKMRAVPVPDPVCDFIEEYGHLLQSFHSGKQRMNEKMEKFYQKLDSLFSESDHQLNFTAAEIISFGPKYKGPNLLVDKTPDKVFKPFWTTSEGEEVKVDEEESALLLYANSFINGFQMACSSGPLCEEPLMGVTFLVLDWSVMQVQQEHDNYGPVSGQIMSTVRELCKRAMNVQPRRLKMAMYSCNIQVPSEALGKSGRLHVSSLL